LCGRDKEIDRGVLLELQRLLGRLFGAPGVEIGHDLLGAQERPLIASAVLPGGLTTSPKLVEIVADAETCLAAAFFHSQESD